MDHDSPGDTSVRDVTPASVLEFGADTVIFRRIQPDDGPRMLVSLPLLSDESRVRRFFFNKRGFAPGELDQLTHCDGVLQSAFVAILQQPDSVAPLVAVGRWIRPTAEATAAEIAFVTRDDWQRRGIGRHLIRLLAADAQTHGITHFIAHVLAGNAPAIKLLDTAAVVETKQWLGEGAWQLRYRIR
jgi:GNAT superfamily N-acetyltransferase